MSPRFNVLLEWSFLSIFLPSKSTYLHLKLTISVLKMDILARKNQRFSPQNVGPLKINNICLHQKLMFGARNQRL